MSTPCVSTIPPQNVLWNRRRKGVRSLQRISPLDSSSDVLSGRVIAEEHCRPIHSRPVRWIRQWDPALSCQQIKGTDHRHVNEVSGCCYSLRRCLDLQSVSLYRLDVHRPIVVATRFVLCFQLHVLFRQPHFQRCLNVDCSHLLPHLFLLVSSHFLQFQLSSHYPLLFHFFI